MRTLLTRAITILALLIALNIGGCAGTSAPRGWLPSVYDSREVAWGAWAEVELLEEVSSNKVKGELIAVHKDTAFVLTSDGLASAHRMQIKAIKLSTYDSQHWTYVSWTTLGVVSTASHGILLVASAPLWLIFGAMTTAAGSRENQVLCRSREFDMAEDRCWSHLSKFARFPQGLPDTVDRGTLLAKPH
jgi:hypothetical protein